MLFNSIEFILFLPIVFLIYWFVVSKKLKLQNFFILIVSYIFYGWWDWRFLILIALTSFFSYSSGLWIKKYYSTNRHKAKFIATGNIILNLIILCLFKYFNFFAENLYMVFRLFGFQPDWFTINILLPVGISFYTFQALSYTIDVYKQKLEPTKDIVAFFAFISFFPQLVAGPIERATNLLPQFYKDRHFDYANAVSGMRQILWGFFKKVVVADNCATGANLIFDNYADQSSSTLLLGAVLFSFQIYGDFSGYSDIAIGTGKLFGIKLMKNFNFPYFSRDIAEFWRRWHISLTTWFRDYIYIPLGGSRKGKLITFRNTMIIFLVSGFWHGANWTFIVWGAYHALLFLPLMLLGKNRKYTDIVAANSFLPSLKEIGEMMITFCLALFGWIIFRAESIQVAYHYIINIFSKPFFTMPTGGKMALLAIVILLLIEWAGRKNEFALENIPIRKRVIRWAVYLILVLTIIFMGGEQATFIYFQF